MFLASLCLLQNVDWHLQHKHLCYKPARLFWSVALYFPPLAFALYPSFKKDFLQVSDCGEGIDDLHQ